MIRSLLIANRGEIARRIIRTARRLGIRTVAVYTEADRSWPHWREADEAVAIGDGPAADSYLSTERIVEAARRSGAEAVHPGYGFLSETAAFAEACEAAGLIFVGPTPAAIRAMGSKAEAKAIAARAGVAVVPGYGGERQEPDFLRQKAYEIGYPVLVKAVAGGGGRGMRRVDRALDFEAGLAAAKREGLAAFGDDRVLIERYLPTSRHIEVQVFADAHGNVLHLCERDCSVQRRHQKVVEEAPAVGLSGDMRQALGASAVRIAAAVGYSGAGTVEFIADVSRGLTAEACFFMEMNTRLQVEHPVTEAVTGLDLVEWQLRVAAGEPLPLTQDEVAITGHAIEARLYAEDAAAEFRPSTGTLWAASFPDGQGIRIESGVEAGSIVGPHYDSMLAKIIAAGETREEALARLAEALGSVRIAGPKTNLRFLAGIVAHPAFRKGSVDTGFIDREMTHLVGRPPEPAHAGPAIAEWTDREARRWAAGAPGPWARTDGFEVGGLERRTTLAVEVEAERLVADLAWAPEGLKVMAVGGAPPVRGPAEIVWAGRDAFILTDGAQLRIGFPDPLQRDAAAVVGTGEITAPLPGRIASVAVSAGDQVEIGSILFTIEAMKMEHTIAAPFAGSVARVTIAPGQQVEQGELAVLLQSRNGGNAVN